MENNLPMELSSVHMMLLDAELHELDVYFSLIMDWLYLYE